MKMWRFIVNVPYLPQDESRFSGVVVSLNQTVIQVMCDMADEMRGETMELCVTACEKHASNNELAARMIKENMDKRFGPSWHAVVGEGYGFEISYEFERGVLALDSQRLSDKAS